MLHHSTTITPAVPYGGDLSALGRLRQLDRLGGPDTLSQYAREALLGGPDGMIAVSWETLIELESNRTGYDNVVTVSAHDTGAAVAAVDASVSSLAPLTDARRNATVRLAVADVTFADDGVSVAGGTPSSSDVHPYGAALATTATVRGNDAPVGSGAWTVIGGGTLATIADVSSPNASGRVWRYTTPTVSARLSAATGGPWNARVRFGGTLGRIVTATAYLKPSGGQLVARFRFVAGDNVGGALVIFAGPTFTLPASASYTRVASPIDTGLAPVAGAYSAARDTTLTGAGGAYRQGWWQLEVLTGTTATTLDVAAAELYNGDDRGPLGGLTAAAPANGGLSVLYLFRLPDGITERIRTVSRVDVHGDPVLGQVTAARVYGVTPGTGALVELGFAAGPGRLAITFPAVQIAGVRVIVEETSSGDNGDVWLSEVDPSYVLDVSDRVIAASTAASRELDPGSATLPLGNVQASTLNLDLDNSDRALSPSSNAMIGTAHRLETAVRIRYANRVPIDPRTWGAIALGTGGIRTPSTSPDGTVGAWVSITTGTVGVPYVETRKTIKVPTGAVTARFGGWTRYAIGASAGARPRVGLVNEAGSAFMLEVTAPAGKPNVWQYVEGSVAVGTETTVSLRGSGSTVPGETVEVVGDPSVVFLDASGNVIETVEALPAGVYFSTGWDSASDTSTVQVAAVDRLGRFGDRDVDEPVTTAVDPLSAIRAYALRYLDLGDDELSLSLSSGYVFPYLFPTGSIGTTLADIAKATNAVLGIDKLDRLTLIERATVPATSAVTVDDSNAVIRARTPIVEEQIANVIDAEAAPLDGVPATILYELGETEAISLTAGQSLDLWLPYTASPATTVTLSTFTKTGTVTGALTPFSDTAKLTLSGGASGGTVTAIILTGTKLETRPLKVRAEHAASIRRYDRRPRTITAALVQTLAQLQAIANAIRDAFSGIDATSGERQLPDVEVDTLGLPYLELGDRLTVAETSSGISGEYQLISSRLDFGEGTSLRTSGRARRVDDALLARADTSLADNAELASY